MLHRPFWLTPPQFGLGWFRALERGAGGHLVLLSPAQVAALCARLEADATMPRVRITATRISVRAPLPVETVASLVPVVLSATPYVRTARFTPTGPEGLMTWAALTRWARHHVLRTPATLAAPDDAVVRPIEMQVDRMLYHDMCVRFCLPRRSRFEQYFCHSYAGTRDAIVPPTFAVAGAAWDLPSYPLVPIDERGRIIPLTAVPASPPPLHPVG